MKEEYHTRFVIIIQIIYQRERLVYFNNHIAIILNLANKRKKINWCSIMLTQMSIVLTQWTEHQKQIVVGLVTYDKKATTCYFRKIIKVCLYTGFTC
jgi:hypothetical protein